MLKNLECEMAMLAGIFTTKIIWFRQSITELHKGENCIIVLPINNSQV